MNSAAILSVLGLIEQVLSILGTSSASTKVIDSIIDTLASLLPYIADEIDVVYTATKNIIAQLKNSGAVTPDQLTSLSEFDTQVDVAWMAIEAQIDPDVPAG